MKKNKGFYFLFILSIFSVFFFICDDLPAQTEFDYRHYERILSTYVHEGATINGVTLSSIDYKGLYKEYEKASSDYSLHLKLLKSFDPDTFGTDEEKIAFWINVYNTGAIKMILDHYPVESIRARKINFFKNPWGKEIIEVNGRLYSLGEIEHKILLQKFKEKSIHFGIVCASVSCPDLSREVYRGDSLYAHLERQGRAFFRNNKKGISIDRAGGIVHISKIFKFDSKSFGRGSEDIIPFILPYITNNDDREYLKTGEYNIEFMDYDWDLNGLQ